MTTDEKVYGDHNIGDVLGTGAFATVHKATDKASATECVGGAETSRRAAALRAAFHATACARLTFYCAIESRAPRAQVRGEGDQEEADGGRGLDDAG